MNEENQVVLIEYVVTHRLRVDMPKHVYDQRMKSPLTIEAIESGEMTENEFVTELGHEFCNINGSKIMIAGDNSSETVFEYELDEIEVTEGPKYVQC